VSVLRDEIRPPSDPTQPIDPDQSLAELVSRMTSDVGALVSTQIELAKVEIKDEVKRAGKGVGMVGGGGLAAYLALLLLSFSLAFALGDAFDSWASGFLLVGVVYAAIAALLVITGKNRITSVTPIAEQTKATLKEDLEWARQQKS
jgi:uncharacterized membrane protein YqjE